MNNFKLGEKVRIRRLSKAEKTSNLEIWWPPEMDRLVGKIGVIIEIRSNGVLRLEIEGTKNWLYDPAWVETACKLNRRR